MDGNNAYAKRQLAETDSQAPSRAEADVSYADLNVTALSATGVRRDEDGLTSTYSELKFPKDKPLINEDEEPSIASKPRRLSSNVRTDPHKQQSKENIANRSHRQICLFCLVTSALIAIVVGLSIYVFQIRQSQITSDQNIQTLCQFLSSKREQVCSQDWIRKNDRCYFISTLETSYEGAKNNCSIIDARLLEIDSKEKENVILNALVHTDRTFWIGKCKDRKKASSLMYKNYGGKSVCGTCSSENWREPCSRAHRFICEKRADLFTDIPEKIQVLCQPSADQT